MADNETPAVPAAASEPTESGRTWYAWTEIRYGAEVDEKSGIITKRLSIAPGEAVTQKKLGISDEEWAGLVEQKVVRRAKLPQVGRYQSPKRALIANAAKDMEVALAGGE